MTAALVLVCILGWGLWCVCEAQAVAHLGATRALLISLTPYIAAAAGLALAVRREPFEAPGVMWGLAAGVASLVAIGAYLVLVRGTASHVAAAATAVYPLVPALLALWAGEPVSARAVVGIVLAVSGAALLTY